MLLDQHGRAGLLRALAAGTLSFRDLAGLKQRDVLSIAQIARSAFETRRFEQAATLFAGLEAIESDNPEHTLNRAFSEAEAGRIEAAVATATRFLESELPRRADDLVRALILRATLLAKQDEAQAVQDIRAAHLIAERSDEAKRVLKVGGR